MIKFSDLNINKPVLRALEEIGLESPTPIQEKAFPVIMSGVDTVGIAQTGTGKTFAYLLPVIRQLTFSDQRHPRILILVPTRELVAQVIAEIEKLTKYITVRIAGIYGASNINKQKQQVYDGVDILVATPGRLIDLTLSRSVQYTAIKKLIIDEVDEMLNQGFRAQLTQILDALPAKRQNILFSATLPEEVELIIKKYFHQPQYVELISRGTPLERIEQRAFDVPNFYTKINLLKHLLQSDESMKRVLVFVRNKGIADDVEAELPEFSDAMRVIHSNKSQPHRFKAVEDFENGDLRILIATDVIARGIDITEVTHVINFDLPKEPDAYIHRIGRTGRADKNGVAISFIIKKEIPYQEAIENLMNREIEVLEIPEAVDISDELRTDEVPARRDKSLKKIKKIETPTGAFHEKKAKNKKVQLGGKRGQEKIRRIREARLKRRGK
jgi:ATP-dependent RNA helicase RhlE